MTIPTSSLRDAVRYLAKQPSNRLTRKPAPNAALVQLCAVSRQSLTLLGLGKVCPSSRILEFSAWISRRPYCDALYRALFTTTFLQFMASFRLSLFISVSKGFIIACSRSGSLTRGAFRRFRVAL